MSTDTAEKKGFTQKALTTIETVGNKLPDPAILFLISMIIVWILSALLAPIEFAEINPRDGNPLRIQNLLTGPALTTFLSNLVTIFYWIRFHWELFWLPCWV